MICFSLNAGLVVLRLLSNFLAVASVSAAAKASADLVKTVDARLCLKIERQFRAKRMSGDLNGTA